MFAGFKVRDFCNSAKFAKYLLCEMFSPKQNPRLILNEIVKI